MELKVINTRLEEIQAFRILFLHENNFQFIYNKCHDYGWADTYLFTIDDIKIGYGSVWGKDRREDRDTIFEFYLIQPFRKFSNLIFPKFYTVSGARFIECQSNDLLLSSMLYEYAKNINAEAILFEDHFQTNLAIPGVIFYKKPAEDNSGADVGGYFLEQNGNVVATGGFMLNYNMPYADIYMEVKEDFRQQGFGSLIVQELKKEIYLMGRVPAARCNIRNHASKPTLLKAGLKICGFILTGGIKSIAAP
ncbi:MAG TPA: GNAT family N-acetyltransferase [Chitinophagaceae bacterium]|nr:GNAT family N-acetyltransferase [Chitinophagaceae bacterium]